MDETRRRRIGFARSLAVVAASAAVSVGLAVLIDAARPAFQQVSGTAVVAACVGLSLAGVGLGYVLFMRRFPGAPAARLGATLIGLTAGMAAVGTDSDRWLPWIAAATTIAGVALVESVGDRTERQSLDPS